MPFRDTLIDGKGLVWYQPGLFSAEESVQLFGRLLNQISWESDLVKIYGRDIVTRRKVAWYGDRPWDYRYSGHSRFALPWTENLLQIKTILSHHCEAGFNSCFLNLYHNGSEGMGWHSDDETSLDPESPIASVSFGEPRRFLFRLRSDHSQKKEILLESGSLLLMDASSQKFWQHSLPISKKCSGPRINLTFRRMLVN